MIINNGLAFHRVSFGLLIITRKNIKYIIIPESYLTHDVICSNLVLSIITLYRFFSVNIFECVKITRWSC